MNDHLVTVANFNNSFDAELAKALLDSSGIDAFLVNSNATRIRPMLGIVGGVQLQVVSSKAEKSNEILQSVYLPGASNAEPVCCPSCDSKNVRNAGRDWLLLIIMIFTFGLFYPSIPFECNTCGFHWRKRIR